MCVQRSPRGHTCVEAVARLLSNHPERSGVVWWVASQWKATGQTWAAKKRANPPDSGHHFIQAKKTAAFRRRSRSMRNVRFSARSRRSSSRSLVVSPSCRRPASRSPGAARCAGSGLRPQIAAQPADGLGSRTNELNRFRAKLRRVRRPSSRHVDSSAGRASSAPHLQVSTKAGVRSEKPRVISRGRTCTRRDQATLIVGGRRQGRPDRRSAATPARTGRTGPQSATYEK
jgi:hypothetical protein